MVRTYIISIADSRRRFRAINYAEKLGLEVEFFDALDARKLSITEIESKFDIEFFESRYKRTPTSPETGCTLSHVNLIKQASLCELNCLVVLEDDFILNSTKDTYKKIISSIMGSTVYDIIVLGVSKADESSLRYINIANPLYDSSEIDGTKYNLARRLFNSTPGAVGYFVGSHGLDVISGISKPGHLADDWEYYAGLGLTVGYIDPILIAEDAFCVSTLDHESSYIRPPFHKNIFLSKILLLLVWVRARIRLSLFTISVRMRSKN